jgi:hypothetical protein
LNWLLTIASNAIKQRFRQEQARPRQVALDERTAHAGTDDDDGPTVGELLAALSKIPPQQRQAIVLREFEGRSYAEIAEILGITTGALETLLFRARRSLAEELEQQLTCTEAQLAISRAADDRLGRKERRRLRTHLGECPDCARFASLQQRHRRALKGLMLIPIPLLSLSFLKGIEGTATAATLPAGASAATIGATVTASGATGGGLFAGGLAVKTAAVVAVAAIAGGGVAVVGSSELGSKPAAKHPSGQRLGQIAPRGVLVPGNGVARGKATAPGQVKKPATRAHHQAANANKAHPRGQSTVAHAKASARHAHAGAASQNTHPEKAKQPRTPRTAHPTRSRQAQTNPAPTTTVAPPSTPDAGGGHGNSPKAP